MSRFKSVPVVSWTGVLAMLATAVCLGVFVISSGNSSTRLSREQHQLGVQQQQLSKVQTQLKKVQRTSYEYGCLHANAIAHGLVDNQLEARRKSFEATIAAPTSTPLQRMAAAQNLASLLDYIHNTLDVVAGKKQCTWPPHLTLPPRPSITVPPSSP